MTISIKKALYSPFNDPKWYIKVPILCFLSVIGCLLFKKESNLEFLIALPLILIGFGYLLYFCHNEIYDLKPLLPEWELSLIPKYLKRGSLVFILQIFINPIYSKIIYTISHCFNVIEVIKDAKYGILGELIIHTPEWIIGIFGIFILSSLSLILPIYSLNFKIKNFLKFGKLLKISWKHKIELFLYTFLSILMYKVIDLVILLSHAFALVILTFLLLISLNILVQIVKEDIVQFENL